MMETAKDPFSKVTPGIVRSIPPEIVPAIPPSVTTSAPEAFVIAMPAVGEPRVIFTIVAAMVSVLPSSSVPS